MVQDDFTREPLTGAMVVIAGTQKHSITGLDGSYSIGGLVDGDYVLEVSFISFETVRAPFSVKNGQDVKLNIRLKEAALDLGEVEIVGRLSLDNEASARASEKNADNVMNVISSKSIEVSPDITVANVIQRVSGLTIERNANGDAQHAIVRGMNKRYNYTLVNGIKIPSPDNENRYVPLDIFPAELLDRLVVSKALTPSMEGDAIGGVVDLRMKDAPAKKMIHAGLSTGFSSLFLERPYEYFDRNAVDFSTPMENAGSGARAASIEHFSSQNYNFENRDLSANPFDGGAMPPNLLANLALGNRYMDGRLGVIVAGSYQNTYRGANRTEFGVSDNTFGNPNPRITRYQERLYSSRQERGGVHAKVDFELDERNRFKWYNMFVNLQNDESRTIWEDGLRDAGPERTLEYNWRGQINRQRIYNSTLQGEHLLSRKVKADWSLVYSLATQELPDNGQIITVSNYDTPNRDLRWLVHENIIRIWERNSDRDYAGYLNFTFDVKIWDQEVLLKTGSLYRLKDRTNMFDLYTFKPNPGVQEYVPFETDFADLTWRITGGAGTPSHVLNYDSYENIFAQYGEFKFTRGKTQYLGGVRAEHTDQGYSTANDNIPDGGQQYWRLLPSLSIKHMPTSKVNLRASYFRSLSRPSFLEIIPYRRPATEEIVPMGGNPNLVAVDAHNLDARFEYFPAPLDQIMVGVFYKFINNPIENAILPPTDPSFPDFLPPATTMLPLNLQAAVNRGVEVDYVKYFNKFGIRANYTFTDSRIESVKRTRTEITADNVDQLTALQLESLGIGDSTLLNVSQTRPLQGQSAHVANFSLLFKDQKSGWNIQASLVYTGEHIAVVSAGLDTDWWARDMIIFDFSLEKKFGNFTAFCKLGNLLDTPYELYIKRPHMSSVRANELQPRSDRETLVRQDLYRRNYLFGVKYNI